MGACIFNLFCTKSHFLLMTVFFNLFQDTEPSIFFIILRSLNFQHSTIHSIFRELVNNMWNVWVPRNQGWQTLPYVNDTPTPLLTHKRNIINILAPVSLNPFPYLAKEMLVTQRHKHVKTVSFNLFKNSVFDIFSKKVSLLLLFPSNYQFFW